MLRVRRMQLTALFVYRIVILFTLVGIGVSQGVWLMDKPFIHRLI